MTAAVTTAPVRLAEAGQKALAPTTGRKYRTRLIIPGWGSSGLYTREVLERDIPVIFPPGSHMHLDHSTATEEYERPGRSVQTLAARITTTPVWDSDGMYADIEVFPHMAPVIEALWRDIGVSISASGIAEHGEADGRVGPIITALTAGHSVDFVTRAGAGGKIVELLESARPPMLIPAREGHGLTANDLRDALGDAIEDTYKGARYSWVQDYSDEWVVFTLAVPEIDGDCDYRLYQQPYTVTDGAVTLTGAATAVDAHTVYTADGAAPPPAGAPVTAPATTTDVEETAPVQLPPGVTVTLPLYDSNGMALRRDPLRLDASRLREAVHRALVPDTVTPGYVYTPPKNVTAGAPPPAPTPQTTEESMGTTQTGGGKPPAEAGQAEVTEAATVTDPQVAALQEQLAEARSRANVLGEAQQAQRLAEARADQAVAESRSLRANDTARSVIAAKLTESAIDHAIRPLFLPRVNAAVLGRVPLTEAGDVDADKLDTTVLAAIEAERVYAAQILEAAGQGTVAGLGSTGIKPVTEADLTAGLASMFTAIGMDDKTAAIAAKGRF